jgi:hypothetical protein
LSFDIYTMPPAHVFVEEDWQIQEIYQRQMMMVEEEEDWSVRSGGENWDEELLVPAQGRMVYVGQGVSQFTHFHEPAPGMLYPKRRKKKKKKALSSLQPPPPPPPAADPVPIDWSDWEEISQFSPPPPVIWEPEDWELEISPPSPQEDWDAEIAASQWQPEDWDAEIAASQ